MLHFESFEPNAVFSALKTHGAVAVPMLTTSTRERLLNEAQLFSYSDRSGKVGKAQVTQQFGAFTSFAPESDFLTLSRYLQQTCLELGLVGARFEPRLIFNEHVVQKYPAGSIGITPHIDSIRCRNMVVVCVLDGDGDFAICDDRGGKNTQVIPAPPGHVIFMAAIGFCGRTEQQFHFLHNIVGGRTTFGMRQILPREMR